MFYVYKLNCDDGIYIGTTTNLERRLANHKGGNYVSNHPFNSYEVLLTTESRKEALEFEDFVIRKYGTLNKKKGGLISKNPNKDHLKVYTDEERAQWSAYWNAHKDEITANAKTRYDEIKAYQKAYYQAHKEQIKTYFKNHNEELKAYQKARYEAHKDELKAYHKARYEARKKRKGGNQTSLGGFEC